MLNHLSVTPVGFAGHGAELYTTLIMASFASQVSSPIMGNSEE
jgi:hypothetical protein